MTHEDWCTDTDPDDPSGHVGGLDACVGPVDDVGDIGVWLLREAGGPVQLVVGGVRLRRAAVVLLLAEVAARLALMPA